MPEILPALSLWQPYASLIAAGAKPYETRHWCAGSRYIGQRIAIHAALRKPTWAEIRELDVGIAPVLGPDWFVRMPRGAVVCTAVLAGCHQVIGRGETGQPIIAVRGQIEDDGFGDYGLGRWCWHLVGIEPLAVPVPAKGGQGWWRWMMPARETADA